MDHSTRYNENLLHWIWKNRHLSRSALTTLEGKELHIHHPGYLNQSDGPDFTNARISIGQLKWHGDVEIHWQAGDWYKHNHHTDPNYNRVVLHVVFEDSRSKQVHRVDETPIPTVCMQPFLSKPLQYFFKHFRCPDTLPCAGNLPDVPESVIREQFANAHREYFTKKVEDLLEFYDPALPLSIAWKHLLIIALFDGLGIRHNRKPMRRLARYLLENSTQNAPLAELTTTALHVSGLSSAQATPRYNWKHKGSRPANHPGIRVKQACMLLSFIESKPFAWWRRAGIKPGFRELLKHIDTSPGVGKSRADVLFGVIWIPAYYLLGDLTGHRKLVVQAQETWKHHQSSLPDSLIRPFRQADIPADVFEKKLGAVHQQRAYCKPHKCEQCEVFKFIISS